LGETKQFPRNFHFGPHNAVEAGDPLASNSRALTPEIVGQEHYDIARGVQRVLQNHQRFFLASTRRGIGAVVTGRKDIIPCPIRVRLIHDQGAGCELRKLRF
jgi:hypothetical protein